MQPFRPPDFIEQTYNYSGTVTELCMATDQNFCPLFFATEPELAVIR